MDRAELLQRLSQIGTLQDHVNRLLHGVPEEQQAAWKWFSERYRPSILLYLRGMTRDATLADDLCQAFLLEIYEGKLRGFDPHRGRFRNFIKLRLRNFTIDYWRPKKNAPPVPLVPGGWEPADPRLSEIEAREQDFDRNLGVQLIQDALAELEKEELQQAPKRFLYTVLRCHLDHPELASHKAAERLAPVVGKALTGDWVRKRLLFARQQLADFIIDAVGQQLREPTPEALQEELADLGLLEYCKARLGTPDR